MKTRCLAALMMTIALMACSARSQPPIVVQGAMDVEVQKLAASLQGVTQEKIQGWTFWRGTIDGYPVVVSKTLKGMENAAAATALAADRYHPAAIINQGTAGGHEPALHVYDIVLGVDTVNLGSFKTGFRARGEGSAFSEWNPLDLNRSEGSAGQDPNARLMRRFHADESLLADAHAVSGRYRKGKVVDGVIGSSEVWNSELDRIQHFHEKFGTSAEEMEAASVAQIAAQFGVPFLAVRVLSNNVTNDGLYDPKVGEACQDYVYEVIKSFVSHRPARH